MANFCRFCGSPLEEGQVCSCQTAQSSVATEAPAAPVNTAAPSLFARLKEVLMGYLKQPKLTAAAVAADEKNGMAIAGILAGVNALAIFLYIWKLFGGVLGPIEESMGALGAMGVKFSLEYPIIPMFISGIVLAAVGIVLATLIVFIFGKMNKQEVDFKKLLVVEATNSILPSALLLVGIVLGFVDMGVQLIVLLLNMILWVITVCADCGEFAGAKATDSFKNIALQTVFTTVALALAIWVIAQLTGWCISEIKIMGVKVGDALNNIGDLLGKLATGFISGGDMSDIMGSLF